MSKNIQQGVHVIYEMIRWFSKLGEKYESWIDKKVTYSNLSTNII